MNKCFWTCLVFGSAPGLGLVRSHSVSSAKRSIIQSPGNRARSAAGPRATNKYFSRKLSYIWSDQRKLNILPNITRYFCQLQALENVLCPKSQISPIQSNLSSRTSVKQENFAKNWPNRTNFIFRNLSNKAIGKFWRTYNTFNV